MTNDKTNSGRSRKRWARLRFSVVGPLLSSPPRKGELREMLDRLAEKEWEHPTTGEPRTFAPSTIERWYYKARNERQDPVAVLQKKPRKDKNRLRVISAQVAQVLEAQYREHPTWSYQLHTDNLLARLDAKPELGPRPSYPSVRRFMKSRGLIKRKPQKRKRKQRSGDDGGRQAFDAREVRSYEAEHVHGLWHLDFHHGSLKVLTERGTYETPIVLGVLDDRSRLCCHAQWYLGETAESLVHGLSQAIQKRGLPRALMTDNGAAMTAHETTEGLFRLGITHQTTLAYAPYQNGKQEVFWSRLEGRLMAMLEGVRDLALDTLNRATQAWVEMEYNRARHAGTGEPPYARFLEGPDVGRKSPTSEELRLAFRQETTRTQRKSDGTISVEGVRFEIPNRYRLIDRVTVRYASWDKRVVHLVDGDSGRILCPLYPLDKQRNADGRRRTVGTEDTTISKTIDEPAGIAPLLERLVTEYEQAGLPWGYLPTSESKEEEKEQ